jgi:glycosyltransferase involved in cell wall biosynthesis
MALDAVDGWSEDTRLRIHLGFIHPPLQAMHGLRVHRLRMDQMAAADCLVSFPLTELRGMPALHALANGVAILGSRYLENADLMHDGVTGLCVESFDSRKLRSALQSVMENSDFRRQIGRQARYWLATRAEVETVRGTVYELIQEAAELKNARTVAFRTIRPGRLSGS